MDYSERKKIKSRLFVILICAFCFVAVFFMSVVVQQRYLNKRMEFLDSLVENSFSKTELNYLIKVKLLTIQNMIHLYSNARNNDELAMYHGKTSEMIEQIYECLNIIDKGGRYSDEVAVNFGNKETIVRNFSVVDYYPEKYKLEVIEIRTKLRQLEDILVDYRVITIKKIRSAMSGDDSAVKFDMQYMGRLLMETDALFHRLSENTNRLFFNTQVELDLIKSERIKLMESIKIIRWCVSFLMLSLMLTFFVLVVFQFRKVLREDDKQV